MLPTGASAVTNADGYRNLACLFLVCGASRLAVVSALIRNRATDSRERSTLGCRFLPARAWSVLVIHFQRGSPIDNPWIALVWLFAVVYQFPDGE
jgi:CDP-diacylglycerol--serine O-phosphatidyltransferase